MELKEKIPAGYGVIGELHGPQRIANPFRSRDDGMLSDYIDVVAKPLRKQGKSQKEAAEEAKRRIYWALETNGIIYMHHEGGLLLTPIDQESTYRKRYEELSKQMNRILQGTGHAFSARCLESVITGDEKSQK